MYNQIFYDKANESRQRARSVFDKRLVEESSQCDRQLLWSDFEKALKRQTENACTCSQGGDDTIKFERALEKLESIFCEALKRSSDSFDPIKEAEMQARLDFSTDLEHVRKFGGLMLGNWFFRVPARGQKYLESRGIHVNTPAFIIYQAHYKQQYAGLRQASHELSKYQ